MSLKWIVSSVVFAIGVGLTACAPGFKVQSSKINQPSCGFAQDVYGDRISWKSTQPVPIIIHESVPTYFYAAIDRAMKDWEDALGRPVFTVVTYGASSPAVAAQDGTNVIYWMSTWEDDRSSEQARTAVYWTNGMIREADIKINAKNYRFYDSVSTTSYDVHLESLLVHELGHVLGLQHQDAYPSVMSTTLAANVVRSKVSSKDVESISCEYNK